MLKSSNSCILAGAFFFIVGTMEVLNSKETFGAFMMTWSLIFLLVGIIIDLEEKKTSK